MNEKYTIEYKSLKIFLNILKVITLILATLGFMNSFDKVISTGGLDNIINFLVVIVTYLFIMGVIQLLFEVGTKTKYRVYKGNIFVYKYNKRVKVIKLKNITQAKIVEDNKIRYLELYTDDRLRLRIPNDMSNYDRIKGLAKEMGWISTLKKNINTK